MLLKLLLEHLEALPLEYSKSLAGLSGYPDAVRVMMYDSLRGKSINDILNKRHWGAILLMTVHSSTGSPSPVGHFISIHLDGDTVQVFDPYGLPLKNRLLTMTKSGPFLLDMILRFHNLSHDQYAEFIGGVSCLKNDELVTLLTMLYHSDKPHGYTGSELHRIVGGWLKKRGLY
jgi:hypothetical protein